MINFDEILNRVELEITSDMEARYKLFARGVKERGSVRENEYKEFLLSLLNLFSTSIPNKFNGYLQESVTRRYADITDFNLHEEEIQHIRKLDILEKGEKRMMEKAKEVHDSVKNEYDEAKTKSDDNKAKHTDIINAAKQVINESNTKYSQATSVYESKKEELTKSK